MIEVSVLTGAQQPVDEGIAFELVSASGAVVASSATDAAGVVTFDVDSAGVGPVAIRYAAGAEDGQ
jgi:hypothetical protein